MSPRDLARAQGLPSYWTGKACPLFKHVALRSTVNGRCLECQRIRKDDPNAYFAQKAKQVDSDRQIQNLILKLYGD